MKPCTGNYEQPHVSNEWHLASGCQELKMWTCCDRHISRALCYVILTLNSALTCSILLLWSALFFKWHSNAGQKCGWVYDVIIFSSNTLQAIFFCSKLMYVCLSMFSVVDLCFSCLLEGIDALTWKYLESLFLIASLLYTRVLNRNVRHRV